MNNTISPTHKRDQFFLSFKTKESNKLTFYTILVLATIVFLVSLTGCSKESASSNNIIDDWSQPMNSELKSFLSSFSSTPGDFMLTSPANGTIQQDSISINFPSNCFCDQNNTLYTGTVKLKMTTVNSVKEMIGTGVTTIHSSGAWLESAGMFKVEAKDNLGNKLKICTGSSYSATVLRNNGLTDLKAYRGVDNPNSLNSTVWEDWNNINVEFGPAGPILMMGFTLMERFTNLDKFHAASTDTANVTIKLPAGFNSSNTTILVKFSGQKIASYFPANSALKAFSSIGHELVNLERTKSYTFLVVAKRDGKSYFHELIYPSLNSEKTETLTSLTETSDVDLKSRVEAFSSK